MLIKKKKLDGSKIEEALGCFEENLSPDSEISLQEFITTHLERLGKIGKKLRELHDFLTSKGFDVGTYRSFRETFYHVKRTRKGKGVLHEPSATTPVPQVTTAAPPQTSLVPIPNKGTTTAVECKNTAPAEEATKKRELYGNRPIIGADGVEYYIDPATGGRGFKI
jgi:hypothetical protein